MKRPRRSSVRSDGLTTTEIRTLQESVRKLQTGWNFEPEFAGPRGLWGMISMHGNSGRAYLVCREEGRILLLNAATSAPGDMLAAFDDLEGLMQYLRALLLRI